MRLGTSRSASCPGIISKTSVNTKELLRRSLTVYLEKIFLAHPSSELSQGFNKDGTFQIADSASKLYNAYIRRFVAIIDADTRHPFYMHVNGVGEVRHHLYASSEELAVSLPL